MNPLILHAWMRRLRRPLVAWLVLAIVAYGPSSTLLQMLGPAHRHEAPVASGLKTAAASLQDAFRALRSWRADLRARWLGEPASDAVAHTHADGRVHVHVPAAGQAQAEASARAMEHLHAHAHAGYARHHHDLADPTVVALDGGAASGGDGASPASSGSATLPLALCTVVGLPPPMATLLTWPVARSARWADVIPLPLERPPQA